MKKPIIGISSNILGLEKGLFAGYKRTYVDVSYINAVINAGGVPHILPMNEHEDIIKEFVKSVDGIILTGGNDVFRFFMGKNQKKNWEKYFLNVINLTHFLSVMQLPIKSQSSEFAVECR